MKTVTYHTSEVVENCKCQLIPTPETWEWVKKIPNGDIHIFEDDFVKIHTQYNGKIKIASLIECPPFYDFCLSNNPSQFHPYKWIEQNHQHFDYIMSPYTFLKEIVGEKYIWIPVGGCRIKKENFGMYEKSRLISIVASHKNWIEGHKLRHEVIKRYPGKIDVYGSGYNNIIETYDDGMGKIIAIAPYAYSFAIMNSKIDDFFTEILIDVLASGTIPLWWGTDNIGKYFNINGIITFKNLEDLDRIIPTLTYELYNEKIPYILDNIERSKEYVTRFDWIYKNKRQMLESL